MKKSLFISILALLFSVAALVKVFYPCKKAAEPKRRPPLPRLT